MLLPVSARSLHYKCLRSSVDKARSCTQIIFPLCVSFICLVHKLHKIGVEARSWVTFAKNNVPPYSLFRRHLTNKPFPSHYPTPVYACVQFAFVQSLLQQIEALLDISDVTTATCIFRSSNEKYDLSRVALVKSE
jgi:hypothetical protein